MGNTCQNQQNYADVSEVIERISHYIGTNVGDTIQEQERAERVLEYLNRGNPAKPYHGFLSTLPGWLKHVNVLEGPYRGGRGHQRTVILNTYNRNIEGTQINTLNFNIRSMLINFLKTVKTNDVIQDPAYNAMNWSAFYVTPIPKDFKTVKVTLVYGLMR